MIANSLNLPGSPNGTRTRVTGVRGRRPRPLDDGTKWLAETGGIRTSRVIRIPYNPQILQQFLLSKKKTFNAFQKAKHYQRLLQSKVVNSKAELARKEGLTRTRIWQVLSLLKLAPEIQEFLGNITDESLLYFFTERRLRKIAAIKDHESQLERFEELKKKAGIREDNLFEMIDQN